MRLYQEGVQVLVNKVLRETSSQPPGVNICMMYDYEFSNELFYSFCTGGFFTFSQEASCNNELLFSKQENYAS